jgi:hypothetical protein
MCVLAKFRAVFRRLFHLSLYAFVMWFSSTSWGSGDEEEVFRAVINCNRQYLSRSPLRPCGGLLQYLP